MSDDLVKQLYREWSAKFPKPSIQDKIDLLTEIIDKAILSDEQIKSIMQAKFDSELQAKYEKAVGALKFYGNNNNWFAPPASVMIEERVAAVQYDGGEIARETLKELGAVKADWGEAERRLHDKYTAALVERDELLEKSQEDLEIMQNQAMVIRRLTEENEKLWKMLGEKPKNNAQG